MLNEMALISTFSLQSNSSKTDDSFIASTFSVSFLRSMENDFLFFWFFSNIFYFRPKTCSSLWIGTSSLSTVLHVIGEHNFLSLILSKPASHGIERNRPYVCLATLYSLICLMSEKSLDRP
jgi:hypothetical protein